MVNKYPLWKNLLLIFIVIIGFLYSAPNLFGDDPAIQISSKGDKATDSIVLSQIETFLREHHLFYKSVSLQKEGILIRFNSTDLQLQASDLLKNLLNEDYTVALNLAPATPAWLTKIGAAPMKLGLDLRGGVHFLLNVDTQSVITHRQEGNVNAITTAFREAKIRYTDIILQKDNAILLNFRDIEQANAAKMLIRNDFHDLELLQQANDKRLIAVLSSTALQNIQRYTLEQTMTTLRNRINELGVSEAVVQQQGNNRISVDLPGIQDTAHAKEILGGTATLEFRMVDQDNDSRTAATGVVPPGSSFYVWQGQPILLKNQVILTGTSITDASSSFDEMGRPSVSIRLGGGGEGLFNRVTAQNIGKLMSVVYVETKLVNQNIDGKQIKTPKKLERIISIATIQSALGNNFQITGLQGQQEAQNLALLLRAGALPAAINYEEERTVGPTLGMENIKKGILSVEVAMLIVILFMALYYRVFGLIADLALGINLILLIALLSLLGATLTLPGIAGIVLTVGMAVDANVLIFERIREELRNGISPQASIRAGYDRALVTIIDANITTLIVAMVLFGIGTDAVKGFAVTLILGLLTSMLSGIMLTRALVNFIYGKRNIKHLSIGI